MTKDIIWSDEQKKLFNWFIIGRKNAICEAVAGGAKSTTIIEGLNRANTYPALYVVFNKFNQTSAEQKITNPKVTVKTYHGLGFGILRNAWRGIRASGYREFERIKQLYPDAPPQFIFQASRLVSYLKNTHINPTIKEAKEVIELKDLTLIKPVIDSGWNEQKMIDAALQSIENSLSYQKVISFEDMLFLPVRLNLIKPTFKLIASDESQDCTIIQMEMILKLALPDAKVCVVGDPKQGCYAFRGALNNAMDIFKEKLNAETFHLSTSYRCPKLIVDYVKQYAPQMKAAPDAINGEIITEKYSNLIKLAKPNDAVLSRTNAPLARACIFLIKNKVPSYILGRDFAKQLIDIIDNFKLTSIDGFLPAVEAWVTSRQPVNMTPKAAEAFAVIQDQASVLKIIAEDCLNLEDIKTKINSLFFDKDNVRVPSVVCSTVHRSKGLEFPNTLVITNSFNCGRRVLSPTDIQQEANIKYICYTRTQNKLIHLND